MALLGAAFRWIAVAAASAVLSSAAVAADVVYDPTRYIDVRLSLGNDTILQFPEDVAWSAEQASKFDAAAMGPGSRTLIIRPKVEQEQRVFFRGASTGTIYLARFSTGSGYLPLINVVAPVTTATRSADETRAAARMTIPGLLTAMMRESLPVGFERAPSTTVLLSQAPLQITAREVWASGRMTGVIVQVERNGSGEVVTIHPASIRLQVPELGTLRAFAADVWELSPDRPTTRGYFVFTR
jgi:hypothetical protein